MNHSDDPEAPHACDGDCAEPGHHPFPGLATHDVVRLAPTLPDAPSAVTELADACVRFVATMVGALSGKVNPELAPDYTPETLSLVDFYVSESRRTLASRPEALPLSANTVGAYLGEVVRRQHRCWWRVDDGDPSGWRLEFETGMLAFYPMQVAYTLLAVDESGDDPWSGFELAEDDRDEIVARLAELPPVSEEEYLLPSTRLEVLDIALETLGAKLVEDPLGKRALGPSDYE